MLIDDNMQDREDANGSETLLRDIAPPCGKERQYCEGVFHSNRPSATVEVPDAWRARVIDFVDKGGHAQEVEVIGKGDILGIGDPALLRSSLFLAAPFLVANLVVA